MAYWKAETRSLIYKKEGLFTNEAVFDGVNSSFDMLTEWSIVFTLNL